MKYPGGKTLSATFDADHNVKSATNARSQKSVFAIAADSSVTGVTYPVNSILNPVLYEYDGIGRLTFEDNGIARQTYTYDASDYVHVKNVILGTNNHILNDTLIYRYNPDGSVASLYSQNIASLLRNTGTTSYLYDNVGNLKEVDYPWGDANNIPQKATYVYDEDDRLIQQTTGALVTTYTYNARGQRISLDNEAVAAISSAIYYAIDFADISQQIGVGKLVAKYDTMKYDGAGNLLGYNATYQPWYQMPHTDTGGSYSVNSVSRFNGSYAYTYDSKDRLASETVLRPNVPSMNPQPPIYPYLPYHLTAYSFTHYADDADNLTTLRSQAATGGYNTDNQFSAGSYDFDGGYVEPSPYAADPNNWVYDEEGRLAGTNTYPVDYYPNGLRAHWRSGVTTALYGDVYSGDVLQVYSGEQLLYDYNVTSGVMRIYGWGAGGINQAFAYDGLSDEFLSHYAFDPQGSPVNEYAVQYAPNASGYGGWVSIGFFDAFGQARQSYTLDTPADNNYQFFGPSPNAFIDYDRVGFGGQWGYYTDYPSYCNDDFNPNQATNGRILLGHRYYDPFTARFFSRDPIGYEGGINLYAYCGNNPIMGIDPSGLTEGWDIVFLAWDAYNLAADYATNAPPSVYALDAAALGIDGALFLIPGAPSGPGHFATAGAKSAILTARTVSLSVRGAQTAYHTARATAPLVLHMAGSGRTGGGSSSGGARWGSSKKNAVRNLTVTKTPAEAYNIIMKFKGNRPTRWIRDRVTGDIIGEATTDGSNRIIRYLHSDRGTPQLHLNLEDKTANTNLHLILKP